MLDLTTKIKLIEWDDQQIGRFDFIKGFYVIGMVLTHAFQRYIYARFQNPTHTKLDTAIACLFNAGIVSSAPFLLLACGYDYRRKSMKNALRTQTKYLWKPYLFTALVVGIASIITMLLGKVDLETTLFRNTLPYILGNTDSWGFHGHNLSGIGAVWFIVVFVSGGLILNAILHIRDATVECIAIIALYCIGSTHLAERFPFGIGRSCRYVLYMYVGYQMKKRRFFDHEFPLWLFPLVGVAAFAAFMDQWSDPFSCLLFAVPLLVLLLRIDQLRIGWFGGIRWLGRHIMYFCCIHTVAYKVLPLEAITAYYADRPFIGCLIVFLLNFAIGILGCILIDRIKRRRIMKKRQKAIGGN